MKWCGMLEVALKALRSWLYTILPNSIVRDLFWDLGIGHGGNIYFMENGKCYTNQGWASPHLRELAIRDLGSWWIIQPQRTT